ncbi:hypothetical protein [Niastella sp. OAS944]|uniref:hypothetical protein n=1 Tax=Niastella sp. OAS944 TaxID=2664089 RepID=UPI0034772551|nr:hypothetical protein [Chitinophagaceae bacterium OAS944]
MEPIEIHQNKRTLIPVLAIFFASVIGMVYYAFFSGEWDKMPILKLVYALISAIILIGIYFYVRKFIKNEPVLILSKSEITIIERAKSVTYLWIQVLEWRIEDSDSSWDLIIKTAEDKKTVNINWLEKDHEEIKELIITYSGKAPRV